jgi:hypothetical protein
MLFLASVLNIKVKYERSMYPSLLENAKHRSVLAKIRFKLP